MRSASAHVIGEAVDIGAVDATSWLSEHGAYYGLCQISRNEPWHYELRPKAIDHGCLLRMPSPRTIRTFSDGSGVTFELS